jgi:hypothetical protein
MQGVCVNSFSGLQSSPVIRIFVAHFEEIDFSCRFLRCDQQQMVLKLVGLLVSGEREHRRRTKPEAASMDPDVQ